MNELLGQTVVVIGGSSGIGLETARHAHAAGAEVILAARDPQRLENVARELQAQHTAAFDANDVAQLERFFNDLPAPGRDAGELFRIYPQGWRGPEPYLRIVPSPAS